MLAPAVVRHLYRLQQQLGLTAPEFRASAFLAGLLLTGSLIHLAATRSTPIDPALYAADEAYFLQRSDAFAGLDTIEGRGEPTAVPVLTDSTLADSVLAVERPTRYDPVLAAPAGSPGSGQPPAGGFPVSTGRSAPGSSGSGAVGRPPGTDWPIDLNRADAAELQRLPRIGPALSARIIAFRQHSGPFRFVEDLLMIRGIGERTLERLRPLVTVNGVPVESTIAPSAPDSSKNRP